MKNPPKSMENTMPYVEVREHCSVTLPADMLEKINAHTGDKLEAKELNGVILLIPQQPLEKVEKEKPSLLSLFGANKENGLYKNEQEIDEYINNLRNEWN